MSKKIVILEILKSACKVNIRTKRDFTKFSKILPVSWILQSTVRLQKLVVAHMINKMQIFYVTRRSITELTRPRHRTLSRASSIHSASSQPVYLRNISMLSYNLLLGLYVGVSEGHTQKFCRHSLLPHHSHMPRALQPPKL